MIAQGSKEVLLGESRSRYDPWHYLLATIELPSISQVVEASKSLGGIFPTAFTHINHSMHQNGLYSLDFGSVVDASISFLLRVNSFLKE